MFFVTERFELLKQNYCHGQNAPVNTMQLLMSYSYNLKGVVVARTNTCTCNSNKTLMSSFTFSDIDLINDYCT